MKFNTTIFEKLPFGGYVLKIQTNLVEFVHFARRPTAVLDFSAGATSAGEGWDGSRMDESAKTATNNLCGYTK